MITDDGLNSLAIFLGALAMLMIVLYHFLEVNAKEDTPAPATGTTSTTKAAPSSQTKTPVKS